MKALITGAGGFVGHHLAAHLVACGDTVTTVDLICSQAAEIALDVGDADAARSVMADVAPDAVYHLAALSHVGDSWTAPGRAFRVNAEGTLNVLRACVDAKVGRVIVVGSSEEYGHVGIESQPITESTPLRPVTPYGASKVAAEFLAVQAYLGDGLEAIPVRPFNHSGPGQPDQFVVPALARRIAQAESEGRDSIPVGSLDVVRDLTDVRDVVRAYRLLVENAEPGTPYNVCSGRGVKIADIGAMLAGLATNSIELVPDPALMRPIDVPYFVGDPSRLRTTTSWETEFSLAQTLADVLEWWRDKVTQVAAT